MAGIDRISAESFAQDWIAAWNSRDLDRVLSHYADEFELSSPLIVTFGGEPSGQLKGKVAIRAYWAKCLQVVPDLELEPIAVLLGVGNSMALHYRSLNGRLAMELLEFGEGGKVVKASALYGP
ncbi:MAG: nuclear transport factor 2 family protein [Nitrospiraceae bacterium]|nr:nuclear transport factor 2 family protein [Nitrospiraceae bacterium]